jgi:hypothetical protein
MSCASSLPELSEVPSVVEPPLRPGLVAADASLAQRLHRFIARHGAAGPAAKSLGISRQSLVTLAERRPVRPSTLALVAIRLPRDL